MITRAHIYIQIKRARGYQYFYKKHMVNFLQNVTKIFNILPLLLKELDIVMIRPPNTENNDRIRRQFMKDTKVRKSRIRICEGKTPRPHVQYVQVYEVVKRMISSVAIRPTI